MTGKTVAQSRVHMTEMVLPSHTNALGSVFGGVVMSWIDIAAAIAAQRHTHGPVVTASVDALNFINPVFKGWIVELKASVNYVGRSSMEVGVRVEGENLLTGEHVHVASSYLTFVLLGDDGRPKPLIPPLILETSDDRRRNVAAAERRKLRRATNA